MWRIICISDTHELHYKMEYDVVDFIDKNKDNYLIHAGDVSNEGSESGIRNFVHWFQNLKGFSSKIFCAGNHDWGFEYKKPWLYNYINDESLSQSDCVYLEDNFITIKYPKISTPIKIYGSPWQPEFCNWAFNVPRDKLHLYWEKIPIDTQILITHSPAYGILDKVENRPTSQGCKSLYEHIVKIKPKIHITGHIHSGRGIIEKDGTIFINASICTERYEPINKPIVIDFDFQTNKWNLIDM
jgi:Calcineurin-like phosphoesterase